MPIGRQSSGTTEIYPDVGRKEVRNIRRSLGFLRNGGVQAKLAEDSRLLENTDRQSEHNGA
jgi:hypothetical protein